MKTLKQKNKEHGFTLVEVLVALTIFSIAVAGVITAATVGGLNVNSAKNKLTATYLADEGIELMRAVCDTSVIVASNTPTRTAGNGWTDFTTLAMGSCGGHISCDIDVTDSNPAHHSVNFPDVNNIVPCGLFTPASPGCPLYYNSSSGYYSDYGTTTPIFTRSIYTSVINIPGSSAINPDELEVTSTVTWQEGSGTKSVTQTETLFNWY